MGKLASEEVKPDLAKSEPGDLESQDVADLWDLFRAIGQLWETTTDDSASMYSQWKEFIDTRCTPPVGGHGERSLVPPSYRQEYRDGAAVLRELWDELGSRRAYELIYLESGEPHKAPLTRFEHLRKFIASEFIEVHLVAGGFRSFGAANFKGYVGGSRYRREVPYRIASRERYS